MTLSLLQLQGFNYFAITDAFNTLTCSFWGDICLEQIFFSIMAFKGKQILGSMLSLYLESYIIKIF